jgi:hypothetical protein
MKVINKSQGEEKHIEKVKRIQRAVRKRREIEYYVTNPKREGKFLRPNTVHRSYGWEFSRQKNGFDLLRMRRDSPSSPSIGKVYLDVFLAPLVFPNVFISL